MFKYRSLRLLECQYASGDINSPLISRKAFKLQLRIMVADRSDQQFLCREVLFSYPNKALLLRKNPRMDMVRDPDMFGSSTAFSSAD
jgi:hypothetical protein